jgi:hypothetical protein
VLNVSYKVLWFLWVNVSVKCDHSRCDEAVRPNWTDVEENNELQEIDEDKLKD